MSHFGTTVAALMEKHGTTAKEIAAKTGIQASQISRWLNERQWFLSRKHLVLMAGAVGRTPVERAEVIAAHLRDECRGPGCELVSVSVMGREHQPAIPEGFTKTMRYLEKQGEQDPLLRGLLAQVEKLYRLREV